METMNSYNSPTTKSLFRGTQVSWYLIGLLETILGFRFVLKLTGANPAAGFTDLVYSISWPFVAPFNAVFPRTMVEGSTFEWTTLLAMAVYYIVALAIIQLFVMGKTVSTPEAAAKLNEQENKGV